MAKLTKAQRATLLACPDWSAAFEILYRRHDDTGEIVDLGGLRNTLGWLRNRGLVEYGQPNNTWRATPRRPRSTGAGEAEAMTRALPKVLTPAMLADYWRCSERHIRNLVNRGELNCVRLGGRLLRIRLSDVEDFECRNGGLPDCEANTASPGKTETSGDVIALEQPTRQKRPAAPRLDTQNSRVRQGRR